MTEIVDDFLAECEALDELVLAIPVQGWLTPTPAQGWDVRDSFTHLAESNQLALECVTTGRSTLIDDVLASGSVEEFEKRHLATGRSMPGEAVRDWWRSTNDALAAALRAVPDSTRIPWGPNRMSPASFTTARLMETWAHGLDCFDALGAAPTDTDRLMHVARLALRALPYAFAVKGLAVLGPVRLELQAPGNESTWTLGEEGAATTISGTAGDWCRAAVNRDRRGERTRLSGRGPDAEAVIANVQAYLSA